MNRWDVMFAFLLGFAVTFGIGVFALIVSIILGWWKGW